jgi:hypothetical protein
MSSLPVVNYGRMERLRPPERMSVPMNANTFAIAFIILCVLGLYKRYVTISQSRERSYTLDTLMPTKRGLSSSVS